MSAAVLPMDGEQFASYQIGNAPMRTYPFPHFYVRPVFPEDYYLELLRSLPPTDALERLDFATGPRFIGTLDAVREGAGSPAAGALWGGLAQWLLGDGFRDLIAQRFAKYTWRRFGKDVSQRLEVEARYVRDFTDYYIGPHTDTPAKLVSLLFYLPPDESLRDLGTSLYAPKDPKFRCPGTRWYKFSRFRRITTMEFLPNSLFAFFKTENSFHGVEPVTQTGIERNCLLYNIYVKPAPSDPPPEQEQATA
jgi:hypothetical protein